MNAPYDKRLKTKTNTFKMKNNLQSKHFLDKYEDYLPSLQYKQNKRSCVKAWIRMLYRGAVIYTITAKKPVCAANTALWEAEKTKSHRNKKQTHYRKIKAVDKAHHQLLLPDTDNKYYL